MYTLRERCSKYCETNVTHDIFLRYLLIIWKKFDCDDEVYISVKYILLVIKK